MGGWNRLAALNPEGIGPRLLYADAIRVITEVREVGNPDEGVAVLACPGACL